MNVVRCPRPVSCRAGALCVPGRFMLSPQGNHDGFVNVLPPDLGGGATFHAGNVVSIRQRWKPVHAGAEDSER